jgi:hypothetical protein
MYWRHLTFKCVTFSSKKLALLLRGIRQQKKWLDKPSSSSTIHMNFQSPWLISSFFLLFPITTCKISALTLRLNIKRVQGLCANLSLFLVPTQIHPLNIRNAELVSHVIAHDKQFSPSCLQKNNNNKCQYFVCSNTTTYSYGCVKLEPK